MLAMVLSVRNPIEVHPFTEHCGTLFSSSLQTRPNGNTAVLWIETNNVQSAITLTTPMINFTGLSFLT